MEEARKVVAEIGLPIIIRPAYILGGRGTGIASTDEEFERLAANGLAASPISEILIEESIAGWKEYELEVMRDHEDNCVIICSIENVDPMGVHTGDSITVAPQQTLTDVEYQQMRDAAIECIRRVGVETGGSNVQFAVDPETGRQVVIEMNPRVSRSSALASKATGFPIAKIAAKLAVGYTLDEIPNDITKATPASFEPTIDYVVTKIPRWAFEKLPGTHGVLGTQMQSVGEAMSIGRTFPESLQKGLRSLEQGRLGLNCDPAAEHYAVLDDADLLTAVSIPTPERIFQIGELLRRGITIEAIHDACQGRPVVPRPDADHRRGAGRARPRPASTAMTRRAWRRAKRLGFADAQLAHLWDVGETEVRQRPPRSRSAARPTRRSTPVRPSSPPRRRITTRRTRTRPRSRPSDRQKVMILGSGPNRIGQGIEFDYCCVHASFALREAGYETVMVNCNPETVSTDYDTSDRLYFEPLTKEDVLNVIDAEQPYKVIVSLGGQTPLKLSGDIPVELVAGTSAQSIDDAEDREKWNQLCDELEHPATSRWYGGRPRAGPGDHRRDRVSGAGSPQLRARWTGDADRARPQPSRQGDGRAERDRQPRQGGRALGRATGADRPLPGERHRGRRRRDPRSHRRGADRWRDGTRRGGRRALRRLGLCDPAANAARLGGRGADGLHHGDRPPSRRQRSDQCPVRGHRHHGVRDRGQPARQSHGALRRQGEGDPARQGGHQGDARGDARGTARRGPAARTGVTVTWRSKRPCCRSTVSRRSIRRSGPRCARPAR